MLALLQDTGTIDTIVYIGDYDSKARTTDLPDEYVMVLGAEFYDEYNITRYVEMLVPRPDGEVKLPSGNFTMGNVLQNELKRPEWSTIFRPPTDSACQIALQGFDENPLILQGICPQNPGRTALNKAIGENRGYRQVAQQGLEQMSTFCVYGWAKGNPNTCLEPFAYGPTSAQVRQGFRGEPIFHDDACQDWCQAWIIDPEKNTSVPLVDWSFITDPCENNWYGVTCVEHPASYTTDSSWKNTSRVTTLTDLWLYANQLEVC